MVAERERAHTMHFIQTMFTRGSPFTYLFVGANLGVFLLMWAAGGMSITSTDTAVLIGFGAKVNNLIDDQQHYWRLITCIFIHIGFAHFVLNNYALWILGQQIEQIYGSSRFVIIYLACGTVGSLASYFFNAEATSAGASGSIFGLFGTMGAFAFRYRREIPAALRRDIIRRIIPIIAINLIFGFTVSVIDNAAHIGGLLGGVVLALIVPYKRPGEASTSKVWRALQFACLGIIVMSFVEAFRYYDGPAPSFSNLTTNPKDQLRDQANRIHEADRLLLESIQLFSGVIQARDEDNDAAPALRAASLGLEKLKDFAPLNGQIKGLHERLVEVLMEQRELIERYRAEKRRDWDQLAREQDAIIDKAERYELLKRTTEPT